jgi:hypothetical protein
VGKKRRKEFALNDSWLLREQGKLKLHDRSVTLF